METLKKLHRIVLIDDDPGNNLLNEIILNDINASEHIVAFQSGIDALGYLKTKAQVDLILLDINMPIMSGWEFLEAYEQLDEALQTSIKVVMLTSSINPDDELKAQSYKSVKKYVNKPIEEETMHDVLKLFD